MQAKVSIGILAFAGIVPLLAASAKQQPAGYQQGTVLSVARQEVRTPDQCCYSATDAPSQSEYYAYEVTVRVGCTTYEGRYETPFDYFPSAFSPGKPIQVRPARHVLYFDVPSQGDLKVPIARRSSDRVAPCGSSAASH